MESVNDPDWFVRFLDRTSTRPGEHHPAVALLELDPDQRCLDVGCGIGEDARSITEMCGARVVGVDVNMRMVRESRSRSAGRDGLGIVGGSSTRPSKNGTYGPPPSAPAATKFSARAARALASARLRPLQRDGIGDRFALPARLGLGQHERLSGPTTAAPATGGQAAERGADLVELRAELLVERQQLGVLALQRLVGGDELVIMLPVLNPR